MHATQKLYDLPSIPTDIYQTKIKSPLGELIDFAKTGDTTGATITGMTKKLKSNRATLNKFGIDI